MLKTLIESAHRRQNLRRTLHQWLSTHSTKEDLRDLAQDLGIGQRALLSWVNDQDFLYWSTKGSIVKLDALEKQKKKEKKNKLDRIKAVGADEYANRLFSRACKDPEFDPRIFMRT
jgi:hypothetical protein